MSDLLRGLTQEKAWAHIRHARDTILTHPDLAGDDLISALRQLNDGLFDLDRELVTERVETALYRAAQINTDAELQSCKGCAP